MNKILRYSFIVLLALVCGGVNAQTKFDFDNDYKTLFPTLGESSNDSHEGDITEATTCTIDGIQVTVSPKASGNNENRIWNASPRLRVYTGTLTIQAPEGKNINKIEFETKAWGSTNTVDAGTLATNLWTGSANKVVITIGKSTTIKTMTVTLEGQGGDTPTPPVEETKAENIAAFKALTSGTTAILTLKDAQVLYKNVYTTKAGATNTEYYVRDASGAIQFFNTDLDLNVNQILNGTVEVKYSPYNDMPEAAKSTNTSAEKLTITDGEAAVPTKVTVADLNTDKYLCDLVTVENVTFTSEESGTFTNNYLVSGDDKAMVYDKFKTGFTLPTDEATYDVTGILVTAKLSGNVVKEFAPISSPVTSSINGITTDATSVNAPAYNLAGQKVSSSYKGVVIKAGKKYIQK